MSPCDGNGNYILFPISAHLTYSSNLTARTKPILSNTSQRNLFRLLGALGAHQVFTRMVEAENSNRREHRQGLKDIEYPFMCERVTKYSHRKFNQPINATYLSPR